MKYFLGFYRLILLTILLGCVTPALAESIESFTQSMEKNSGFFNTYWDEKAGKLWLRIDSFDKDFLYAHYLKTGVGSNDIGLDRGQTAGGKVVKFMRYGPQVLLVQTNLKYRAMSENIMEVQAVREAFAESVLWSGKIQVSGDWGVLVDITDFFVRDSHGVAQRLKSMKQGNYQLDKARSVINGTFTRSFADNTEFESIITFKGSQPGQYIRSVAPDPLSVTVTMRHSFVRLPGSGYKPRKFDPRSGAGYVAYRDYASPLGQPIDKKFAVRHRLQKKYPEQAVSDPIEPIVYYLDPGTPEPVRSALLEGASWWAKGFEAAGFSNAFQVKMLPHDADPLDIRYNTIQWVHRSTRGWSYGASIVDPRTGEILKGHVTLGSLRVRQDMRIAQALLSPYKIGNEKVDEIEKMALARLRQLSAHEVGHTLGFMHNFSASTRNRASVMDYPHPLIQINEVGEIDLSNAYTVGLGEWDSFSMAYLYSEFVSELAEQQGLERILTAAAENRHTFISDSDARMPGGSHPDAHLWDNGSDSIQSLKQVMAVRRKALDNFGIRTIGVGEPLFNLEQLLAPVYLFHRYQTEAVVKLVAGVNYRYAIRGEQNVESTLVSADRQKAALDVLMRTIQADELAIKEDTLRILLPPVYGSARDREHFDHRTGLNFDALAAVEGAARFTLSLLLNSQRAARLIEHNARNPEIPGLGEVIETVFENTWYKKWDKAYHSQVQHSINWVVLQELMQLAANKQSSPQVRAVVIEHLDQLRKKLSKNKHHMARQAVRDIRNFMEQQNFNEEAVEIKVPPGSPIGS